MYIFLYNIKNWIQSNAAFNHIVVQIRFRPFEIICTLSSYSILPYLFRNIESSETSSRIQNFAARNRSYNLNTLALRRFLTQFQINKAKKIAENKIIHRRHGESAWKLVFHFPLSFFRERQSRFTIYTRSLNNGEMSFLI